MDTEICVNTVTTVKVITQRGNFTVKLIGNRAATEEEQAVAVALAVNRQEPGVLTVPVDEIYQSLHEQLWDKTNG